jgi:superfamily II DNA or RNA helicase
VPRSPRLTTADVKRLVGLATFERGLDYALDERVEHFAWHAGANCLMGVVQGNRPTPYRVTIVFAPTRNDQPVSILGTSCTCPMTTDCKHVAAVLLAYEFALPADESSDPQAEPVPGWRRALAPLVERAPARRTPREELALQFTVMEPRATSRFSSLTSSQRPRLGVRPVIMGKKGRWVQGGVSWSSLVYSRERFDARHWRLAREIHGTQTVERGYEYYAPAWIEIDQIDTPLLWQVLALARDEGLPLVLDNREQSAVEVSSDPATCGLDIVRTAAGLDVRAVARLDGAALPAEGLGFVGTDAHGVFAWEQTGGSAKPTRLTLAPLADPVSAAIADLALSGAVVTVPAGDETAFATEVLPLLATDVQVLSHDGSYSLPELPRPVLELRITHQPGVSVTLEWGWRYVTGDADVREAVSCGLWPTPSDTTHRDADAEERILTSVDWLIEQFPRLGTAIPGRPRLAIGAALTGTEMIAFIGQALPVLEVADDVRVEIMGDAPAYREAVAEPEIRLSTTERGDRHDWFDLAVTVAVDGEEIPFDELFRALATEQEVMILSSGTYFTLDRPVLQRLRRLIEEARSLQESSRDSLGLSRYQVDLWGELEELGIVADQAASWRQAVAALAGGEGVEPRDVPAGVLATLRGYQLEGFAWLAFLRDHGLGGILADDMGLGKTLQAIALIAESRADTREPFLVVAPASVVHNWASECHAFAPSLRVAVITETAARRAVSLADAVQCADVVVTSYTLFRLEFEAYEELPWAGLLLDEAQFVKNRHSRAHMCARRLPAPFKLAITGTPMENNLMELWSLLSITAPGLFPNPQRFAEYYQKPIETEGNAERLAQLRRRIRPFMLRRTKQEVATDLPPKQEQVLELDLHPRHRKVYETHLHRERAKVLGLIDDMQANRFQIFRSLTMLRQLSLDAGLVDDKYATIPSAKLDALMELLDDVVPEGHRMLVFSQFTRYLAKARARLDAAGITYAYLDGRTRNRAKAIDDFRSGAASVFLISLKAGGFGLNLTEADYVVLLDPWWNPATEAQAVDRTHRIGQDKPVVVYRLVAKDTIEEKVMALKAEKAALFEGVMSGTRAEGTGLTADEIRELLS